MYKSRKLIYLLIICSLSLFLPSLACKWLTDPTEKEILDQKILNQGIVDTQESDNDKIVMKNIGYIGNMDIITDSPCEKTASATLMAYDDNTCRLSFSYQKIYTLSDGTCNPAGFTEKWNIYGALDESTATCNIQYCNKPSYYSGSGKVRFNSSMAWGDQTITCTSTSNGETDITLKGFVLMLSAP